MVNSKRYKLLSLLSKYPVVCFVFLLVSTYTWMLMFLFGDIWSWGFVHAEDLALFLSQIGPKGEGANYSCFSKDITKQWTWVTPVRFLAPRVQRNNLVQETLHSCRFSQGFTDPLGVPPPWRRPSWAGWRVSGEMLWCRVVLTSTWSQCIRIWLESIVLTSFFGDYMWRHWTRARTFLLSLVFSIQAPSLSLAICSSSGGSEPHHGFASS